jgi:single-stranded DNA-specific DHH superfamily exonuclease
MFQGVNYVLDILKKSTKYLVYFDPDIDGLIAGYFAYDFLLKNGITAEYHINENRRHGFFLDENDLKGYTIIAVDFFIEEEHVKRIVDAGVNLINIDHHEIDTFKDNLLVYENNGYSGVVINNQYSFEPDNLRFLSGAGVVFFVLSEISSWFNNQENVALMGITLLTDIRPVEANLEFAQQILSTTFTNKSKKMVSLINLTKGNYDFDFGAPCMDRNFIDYTFSPKLSALFRFNMGDEAIKIIFGNRNMSIDLEAVRKKQNSVIDDILVNLVGDELSNLTVKYVRLDNYSGKDYNVRNFIGVACSRIKGAGKSCFLYVRDGDTLVRGSFRGFIDNVDYLGIFKEFGLNAAGHTNAFGVLETLVNNVDFNRLNEEIKKIEEGKREVLYQNRILDIDNFFVASRTSAKIARYNMFVRDVNRIYYRYNGSNIERIQKGAMWEFIIDGIKGIKCFQEDLNTKNGLILPLENRGYITYFLRQFV